MREDYLTQEMNWGEVENAIYIVPNRTKVIIIYPTVDPEVVIVPIVSSIIVFPIVAFLVICCLKKRAERARARARLTKRENNVEQSCVSNFRFSPPLSGGRRSVSANNIEMEMTTTIEIVTPDS